jgi:carbon monoxide dehydrogenase subunit G
MQLNGVLQISVPPARVASALEEPEVLRALLPGEARVERTSAGQYSFTLKKTLGFLELRQGGTIQLLRVDQGVSLVVRAAHRIGGAADLSVLIGLAAGGAQGKGTRIAYDGKMEASGLAGRLLRDREAQVRPYIAKVFERMRAQIEAAPPAVS